jgi:hypothetical protein
MKRTSRRRTSRGKSKRTSRRSSPLKRNYTPPRRDFQVEPREGDTDENGELTLRGQVRQEMVRKLADEWNQVHGRMEERSFRSDEDREAEDEAMGERAEDYAHEKLDAWLAETGQTGVKLGHHKSSWPRDVYAKHEEFIREFYSDIKDHDRENVERLSVIEEMLGELGGRMMRPYEHWNEEEAYREYAERDRDDGY